MANKFKVDERTTLTNVHDESAECRKYGCVIHCPSDHHMRDWPLIWRTGGLFDIKPPHFERQCPHGIGHPDPDSVGYLMRHGEDPSITVHGCDGCCRD